MIRTITRNGLMLGAFAIVTTALIAFTYAGTKSRIEDQQRKRLLSVLNEVVPAEYYDNAFYQDCTLIQSEDLGTREPQVVYRARKNGEPAALAIETVAPDGYSGDIHLVVGVDTQMKVLGVRAVEHKETPGLGDKIELAVSDWILSFTGKQFDSNNLKPWQVKKDGGQFDQFTGATITPRAVVNAVKETLLFAGQRKEELFNLPGDCATVGSGQPVNQKGQTE